MGGQWARRRHRREECWPGSYCKCCAKNAHQPDESNQPNYRNCPNLKSPTLEKETAPVYLVLNTLRREQAPRQQNCRRPINSAVSVRSVSKISISLEIRRPHAKSPSIKPTGFLQPEKAISPKKAALGPIDPVGNQAPKRAG